MTASPRLTSAGRVATAAATCAARSTAIAAPLPAAPLGWPASFVHASPVGRSQSQSATRGAYAQNCVHAISCYCRRVPARLHVTERTDMRAKGMAYDTGFVSDGVNSLERFDPEVVRRELTIIRDDLHCNAVQIVGGDPQRLELAARAATELGLEVWFSPYPLDLRPDQILALLLDCAERAERLRAAGAEVVFVAGVELSLMNRGFVDGDRVDERLGRLLANPDGRAERIAEVRSRLNQFLRDAVAGIRERFHGKVTYAAIPFEGVDWDLFDFVTLELIRSAEVAGQFRDGVRNLVAQSKPVAVTAFVYLFALYSFPHRPDGDPRDDLDLASLGIVKVLDGRIGDTYPDMPWEPKAAFATIAEHYSRRHVQANP